MSKFIILYNILTNSISIVIAILVYHVLVLIGATDVMFKLFWWIVWLTVGFRVIGNIITIKRELECEEGGD